MKYLFFIVLPMLLWSCSTTKSTTTSSDLYSNDQQWPVTINDGWLTARTISFGPFKTTPKTNGLLGSTFIKSPKDPFYFRIEGNNARISIESMSANGVAFSSQVLPKYFNTLAPNVPVRYYRITNTGADNPYKWEMIIKAAHYLELNNNKAVGILRERTQAANNSTSAYRITAHNHFGKVNSYENICYEFYSEKNNKLLAAVIPGEKPKVWMDKNVDSFTKDLLAAGIAGLLL
ncbi:hypothetical protein SAMN05660909_04647 [Chitinophaga terrae (ex Kim and Jung 2007)]|uniref:Uncharacterized protein n=1 Tax=Chitinophaga terrae (ex Kim and Jung 2007) TaxID=408074 RepID=A0A1H4FT66_9BACT|nr:hypothetical protein [Chitinophaga terrae (ex Kim and Jung 2007)]SEB00277.1 hypothetical protein SAMN05660909_04647 [Chitinophaga terrae (ex Kim and Jung 2007)]